MSLENSSQIFKIPSTDKMQPQVYPGATGNLWCFPEFYGTFIMQIHFRRNIK